VKRIVFTITICILLIALCACNNKLPPENVPDDTTQNENVDSTKPDDGTEELPPVEPKPVIGEEVDEVYLFDENSKPYTAETLPKDYYNKDFDGDKLKNKDEIANGTDMYKIDTDDDGLSDYDEINESKTDPLKWSSRDDDKSDLEYYLINKDGFKAGYTSVDANGFQVYLEKAEDRLWVISKTSTDVFNDLETISEAYQIKYFSGKLAVNCGRFVDDVANCIAVYKIVDDAAVKVETTITSNKLVEFSVEENDIFVLVYKPIEN
jgi:hypothetical protein